ncbi:T9SS type A sorting domain-containing protein [Emticicia sp. W12TSBA100-4]|uniref:T9SS type A sorting domain-containing protein n=1 Tax=Emticicia sp. W12TSBA100-4 TaxID=3160965 RepID=UPI00330663D1
MKLKYNKYVFGLLFLFGLESETNAQNSCQPSSFLLKPTTQNRTIEWQKFPEFSLPFSIVYGGPRFGDFQKLPLKHGFSHLATSDGNDADLPRNQRAAVWYGTGYASANQPWETIKSPWGNNIELYKNKWRNDMSGFANAFSTSAGTGIADIDLFVPDIELQIKSNDSILLLRNHPTTPVAFRSLDNQSFITQYKKDIQALYGQAFADTKKYATSTTKIGGYSDAPILNTYINIAGNSWQKWTSDVSLLNYINYDFSKNALGGTAFDNQDFYSPAAYYYYDFPSPLAPDYLAYLLFQIEVNRAWTSKPIIPFVWLRYSYTPQFVKKFIRPFMAEATAIFPFFSGAKGLWLWDDPGTFSNNENYATYEYFINGLYRLSQYKEMFTGNYELVMQTTARDYVDTRKPIWRAVAKGNELLVAAHNPYAKDENEVVTIEVAYKNYRQNITLKGYEVFLCKFDMTLLGSEPTITNFEVSPNPASDQIQLKIFSTKEQQIPVEIFDVKGKKVLQEKVSLLQGDNVKFLNINSLYAGAYFLRVLGGSKKIVVE